ncbi:Swarming motility protein SwrC [Pontibacillus halophilus JSM 076056 = DSM 19796]|uniref:Swarming motility protein SwrC n=1 Tax=Pontibacillus halophilus JSM 076056 = DSM 19796 TaxID=1385510 RepID=A0A0A5ID55_9BACI|nr:efflux RND transporter permease subunit [Pontibacillus halophilus]KGX93772.1 Swarming motility protein SwrC [Pontibacillus halophilus JSM 076056 = DSM 19796]
MDKLIKFTLNNKFAVWLLTIIVTVAGIYSGTQMKMETIPSITTPVVSVTTTYPGATPEEVADKVSEPIEKQVENIGGVNVVSSSSFQNASNVQVEFNFEKDMDEAEDQVEEALSSVAFPDGVQEPDVSRLSIDAFPIMAISVTNGDSSLAQLTTKVEEEFLPKIEGLEGVASVQLSGQQVQQVNMDFDEDQLASYGLTEDTIKQLIQGSDITYPLGLYTFDNQEQSVVVDGNVSTLEELKNLQIPAVPQQQAAQQQAAGAQSQQGAQAQQAQQSTTPQIPTVALDELADIELVQEAESISRTNGSESIGLQIVKAPEANTVDVVNAVKEAMTEFEEENEGITVISTFDQGEPIEESVMTMFEKALFGALFAIIIILLFLRDVKSTVISVVSIPLSLLIALLVLNQMDITLNIMTLGAMTVAIGRVVDDSIVVIENVYRRMSLSDEKLRGKELIRSATKEVFVPILSSTIVTIAVFLPLGLVSGTIGELFLPFALTVVFALLASLLVAVTIVPVMAHSFFKKGIKDSKKHEEDQPGKLAQGYRRFLNWTLNHKIITSLVALAILVGSVALVPVVGVSFLPPQEDKMVIATYTPEPGQTEDEVLDEATAAEEFFTERADVETVQFSVGSENPMNPGQSNGTMFFVEYAEDTENFSEEKEKVIEELQKQADKGEWASQDFASTGSNTLQKYVYGDSMEDIEPVINDIKEIMEDKENLNNVETSISEAYTEYTLKADQEELSKLGLTAAQVGMELRSGGAQQNAVTTIESDGEEVNVYVATEKEEFESVSDLTDKTIQTQLGTEIPISDVVEVQEGETADTVTRRDGQRYASVSAEITSEDIGAVTQEVESEVQDLELPEGVSLDTGGVSEDINESFTQLGLAMLAAIAIVYLILVITFGGALAPFAILFSLPFTVIGAILGLLVTGETLSVSAMIGALMLIGIVVTNAIVLIDRVIHREEEGYSVRESLLEAGATRLRPILMTALATIGALLPLAFGIGGSGFISKGLGVTVIGGLTSSTLLTLIIVPVIYEALSKFRKKRTKEVS